MNKILVYGGLGLTGLAITSIILVLIFGVQHNEFQNMPKNLFYEFLILWLIGTGIMLKMGNVFLEKGLICKQPNNTGDAS